MLFVVVFVPWELPKACETTNHNSEYIDYIGSPLVLASLKFKLLYTWCGLDTKPLCGTCTINY